MEIRNRLRRGDLDDAVEVCREGTDIWKPLYQVPELARLAATATSGALQAPGAKPSGPRPATGTHVRPGSGAVPKPAVADARERPATVTFLAAMSVASAVLSFASGLFISRIEGVLGTQFLKPDQRAFIVGSGVVYLVQAAGLYFLQPWGRVVALVTAAMSALAFPVGTVWAALVIRYLLHPGAEALFSGKNPVQRTAVEAGDVERLGEERSGTLGCLGAMAGVTGLALVVLYFAMAPVFAKLKGIEPQLVSQRRIEALAKAVESYNRKGIGYPEAASTETLRALLTRVSIEVPETNDGWGRPFAYQGTASGYAFGSAGADGLFEEQDLRGYARGAPQGLDGDLVYVNGEWIRGIPHGRKR